MIHHVDRKSTRRLKFIGNIELVTIEKPTAKLTKLESFQSDATRLLRDRIFTSHLQHHLGLPRSIDIFALQSRRLFQVEIHLL